MAKFKTAILGLSLLSNFALSESTTYQSIPNELTINSEGIVQVKVLMVEKTDEIICAEPEYDFSFNLETIARQKWYDTLLLSRNANSLIDFIYEDTSCSLLAIKLPKLYEHGTDVTSGKQLQETGDHGNVALIGSNVLAEANYSASGHYGQDVAAAAFDGYIYSDKSNQDATDKIGRGIWLYKISDDNTENSDDGKVWIQVDFNKNVTLKGVAMFLNAQALELGRSPRNTVLYTSVDGVEFKKAEELMFSFTSPSGGDFSSPITSRFFRLEVKDNYGDRSFVEIDELEFYQ